MPKFIAKIMIAVGLLASLQVIHSAGVVRADECSELNAQAKKERSILKRLSQYRSAVLICPEDAELLYSYAYSLERMRKYKDALLQYQKVVELDPSMAKAYFNMGDIYRNKEEKDLAINAYEQGLKISPDNPRAKKRLQELKGTAKK
jgi:tetratricopeptide (TPR) repeat protein